LQKSGVSTGPGATALTVMPRDCNSFARTWVMALATALPVDASLRVFLDWAEAQFSEAAQ